MSITAAALGAPFLLGELTGLSDNSAPSSRAAIGPQGHIRADIHVHGNPHKTTVKATGQIEAKLHRWPKAEVV